MAQSWQYYCYVGTPVSIGKVVPNIAVFERLEFSCVVTNVINYGHVEEICVFLQCLTLNVWFSNIKIQYNRIQKHIFQIQ